MSLSHSLTAAYSGLTASAKAASIVAENMSNLRTPGYGRRDVVLASGRLAGVSIVGVTRNTNPVIMAERRAAQAGAAAAETRAAFLSSLEGWLGIPGAPGSLDSRITAFDTALIAGAAAPGSEAHLASIFGAAQDLAGSLRAASDQVQLARGAADRSIATDVGLLNDSLKQVETLNRDIMRLTALRQDTSSLVDQRQVLVDRIADIVPLREVPRDGGQIALYSAGGAALIDGRAGVFDFQPSGQIGPGMSTLPGLTLNNRPIGTDAEGLMRGGRLAASFAVRDDLAPKAQARLDAVARDLISRFEGMDTTLAPGAPGLFTDAGSALDLGQETGLAGRIAVNAAVDPGQGGALWRLRDGLGAAVPGDVGNGRMLTDLSAALTATRPTASGGFLPGTRGFSGLAADLVSGIATSRLTEDAKSSQSAARYSALAEIEAQGGVDSDRETQLLLMIERAYAANARVIQAVEEMLDRLLEI
jgi:flagellar hook-associated protein 1